MKEVLESKKFNVVSKGPELEIINKLIKLINRKVDVKHQIKDDSNIDWISDFGRSVSINDNCVIRIWNIENLSKKGKIIGVSFRVSLFYDED